VAVRPSCSCRFRRSHVRARGAARGIGAAAAAAAATGGGGGDRGEQSGRGAGRHRGRARDPAAVALPLSLLPESRASARPSLRRTRARVLARPRRTAGVVLRRAPTLINAKLRRCAYFPARQAISSRDGDGDTRARACSSLNFFYQVGAWIGRRINFTYWQKIYNNLSRLCMMNRFARLFRETKNATYRLRLFYIH